MFEVEIGEEVLSASAAAQIITEHTGLSGRDWLTNNRCGRHEWQIPYKRKGKSLAVEACGCNNEILINTFGVITLVIGISMVVSPF